MRKSLKTSASERSVAHNSIRGTAEPPKGMPLHISQAFNLQQKDDELDFFDANLQYDSKLFIDPFLLRKSIVKKERELFERFGDFFRFAYDRSLNIGTSERDYKDLLDLLDFSEPKELCLGYTEYSVDGKSPGKSFAKLLIKFFLKASARRLIREDKLYPNRQFNPVAIEIFTRNLGADGLSDITANLVIDYLIKYTQRQCHKLNIPMKDMAVNADGFDFSSGEMAWRGGGRYELPENPLKKGLAIIFAPKRLLRALDSDEPLMVDKIISILRTDPNVCRKFSKLLEKQVDDFNADDIRQVLLQQDSVFKKYMAFLDKQKRNNYDFDKDPLAFYAHKKYSHLFEHIEGEDISTDTDLIRITLSFVEHVVKHLSTTDIWRDMWKWKKSITTGPNSEKVFQRIVFAMGKMYFLHFPDVTFEPEVGTGNGPVDFKVILKDRRIVIELKRLLSASYLDGVSKQLVEYAKLADTNYAIYVTAQHYTRLHPRPGDKHDDGRVVTIEEALPGIQKKIKKNHPRFKKLYYFNIDVSEKPSASKLD